MPSAFVRSALVLVALAAVSVRATPLVLHPQRAAPTDLAVTGRVDGIPPGETRFIRWADLRKLPSHTLKLSDEFVPGVQDVTVVFLEQLWAALPLGTGADTVLATCTDGYAGVFRETFIRAYRPFLVLAINGDGPDKWPPAGLSFNPGPYVVSVSPQVVPAVADLIDVGHKKPWGVTTLEFASYAERFRGWHTGAWSALSPRAQAGRELWVHSCTSCHAGPPDTFGGTKGGRAFDVLATHARVNPAYFKRYVREPRSLAPEAKMEPHPHYSDAQLDALIALLTAEPPRG